MTDTILDVRNLKIYYPVKIKNGLLASEKKYVKAVDGISFSVAHGETFGIVGESGCGKSTTAKALMNMVPFSGSAQLIGQELHGLKDELAARGVKVSHNAVWTFMRREGLTFKKNSVRA